MIVILFICLYKCIKKFVCDGRWDKERKPCGQNG